MPAPSQATPPLRLAPLVAPLALLLSLLSLLVGCAAPRASTPAGAVIPETQAGLRPGTWRQFDNIIHGAISEGTFDGAVLVVSRRGETIYQLATGTRDPWDMDSPRMTPDTIFDTASLAKPVAAATAAAFAVRDGHIDPSDSIGDAGYSLDDLLLHRAGMPENVAWQRLADLSVNRPARDALLLAIGDVQATTTSRYSNAGYLLAGCIVEDATGARLGEYLSEHAWQPLGMSDTTFRLPEVQRSRAARAADDIAPGQPFDPLADYWLRAIGRDPGHSGLFTTADDLAIWSAAMIRALNNEDDPLHPVARFVIGDTFELRDPSGQRITRTRGFLVRTDDPIHGPVLEHTGYTGCALWLDQRRELCIVLLTCGADVQSPRWRRTAEDILRAARTGARHAR
jgi:CubicO group peptidase (beta-lactamase class C family)